MKSHLVFTTHAQRRMRVLRRPSRSPLLRGVARLLICALTVTLVPAPSEASRPGGRPPIVTNAPSGNRTQITEGDGTVRDYSYDPLYRLTGERVTVNNLLDYEKTFGYDPVGNRLQQVTTGSGAPGTPTAPGTVDYTYDTRDRLLTETSVTGGYTYDDNGNLVTKGADATYTWDFENRLTRVQKADGTLVDHAYDADGNRVQTRVTPPTGPPTTTNFLVDTSGALSHAVAETDEAGTLKAHYVRGDDLLAVLRPDATAPTGWQARFHHADHIGSVRRLTDETGNITDGYTYSAFGELLAHTGTDPQPYAFAGEPYDPNIGFQYHRARWMDPRAGRFLGMDPFGGSSHDPLSLHRYLYAGLDPIGKGDPTGRMTINTMMTSMGMMATLARTGLFSVGGALVGAFDAWVGGEDSIWLAAQSGATWGGAAGILWPYKAWQLVASTLGFVGGGAASYQSFRAGRITQGIFRGLLALGSVSYLRGLLRPIRRADVNGVAAIIDHLKSIDAYDQSSPYNVAQVERLSSGKWSQYDQNFYQHELLEARLVSQGMSQPEAHIAALEQLRHTGFELYDPEVVGAFSSWFNGNFPGFRH